MSSYILPILFASSMCYRFISGEDIPVFEFQRDNVPTVNSRGVRFFNEPNKVLINFSVCVRVKPFHFKGTTSYVFSYATSDDKNNELNLGIDDNYFVLAAGGSYDYSKKTLKIRPMKWYHLCFVLNSDENSTFIYLDGTLNTKRKLTKLNIPLNGSLVLGQETDKYNGGFNHLQSFSGRISDFNIYNKALTDDEIRNISSCETFYPGDILSWQIEGWEMQEEVTVLKLPYETLCNTYRAPYKVMLHRMPYNTALDVCKNYFRSTVFLPRTIEENKHIFDSSVQFFSSCQARNHATGFLWIGLTEEVQNKWVDSEKEVVNYTNFREGLKLSKSQKCVAIEGSYNGSWNDVGCNKVELCPVCEANDDSEFTLRGICLEDTKESKFILGPLESNLRRKFRGFVNYEISAMSDQKTWKLIDMWNNETIASIFVHDGLYPVGTRNWTVQREYAFCNQPGVSHKLTLSTCMSDEYTCREGTCIRLSQRCDLRSDCPDNSDEMDCEKLRLPFGYMTSLPPPGEEDAPLKVETSIDIDSISEIDHQNMRLTLDLMMTLTWNDLRLTFANLKKVDDLNQLHHSEVWTLKTEFLNADFRELHRSDPSLKALKYSASEPDDLKYPVRDELYKGSKNPLRLQQRIKSPFTCHMELETFPFDIQTCEVKIKAAVDYSLVQWDNIQAKYKGELLLTEFEVGKVWITDNHEGNYSTIHIHFQLLRRFSYYITSAYLPTFMLMVISYASLFCKVENVDLRVMMSITILLVLYSLYQQISDGLPKTSYAKALDIWCFFALIIIFSQVVLHVMLEMEVNVNTKKISTSELSSVFTKQEQKSKRLLALKASRYLYVLVFVIFSCVYWTVVVSEWNRMVQ